MLERYGARTLEVQPQTVAFNAADEPHSNSISGKGARFLILEIGSELITRIDGRALAFSKSTVFKGGELNWLGLRLHRESSQNDAVTPVALEGLGLEMLATLFRLNDSQRGKQPPRWVEQARELIHAQFTESLSVSRIATTVGVHPVHLARTFRKHYRCSISDYVRRLRIERAQHDISSSCLSLAEVALQTGFCDQGHLTRVFKRLTGITPAKYRARFRLQ